MKMVTGFTQIVGKNMAINFVGKSGSAALFVLSLVIIYQLFEHGQAALGSYMLLETLMKKCKLHNGKSGEAVEHAVHMAAHGTNNHQIR
jgi:fumarate hydratase class II